MVHRLRNSKRLPAARVELLASLLDFAACANAEFDDKEYCRSELRTTCERLERAGLQSTLKEFVRRLHELEVARPSIAGGSGQFSAIESYREAVVRLSLGMVASLALGNLSLDDAIQATYCDDDLVILFRIVMQCQIIDDVLDYRKDVAAGLPSFLTAIEPLPNATRLIWLAACGYTDGDRGLLRCGDIFPLRIALHLASACAKVAIVLGRVIHKNIEDVGRGTLFRNVRPIVGLFTMVFHQ
jgi:hypothetical protein